MSKPSIDNLHRDHIHIWYLRPEDFQAIEAINLFKHLLSHEEIRQRNRFTFESGQHRYLLTRGLIRSVLSSYFPKVAPSEWHFSSNQHGRPHVASPTMGASISFNLSHTQNLIVCALTLSGTIGVDAEFIQDNDHMLPLAERYYAPAERQSIDSLSSDKKKALVYRLWTLKEAFIKAEGKGLAISLNKFWFLLDDNRILFETDLDITGEHYSFSQFHFYDGKNDSGCELAVALHSENPLNNLDSTKLVRFSSSGSHTINNHPPLDYTGKMSTYNT